MANWSLKQHSPDNATERRFNLTLSAPLSSDTLMKLHRVPGVKTVVYGTTTKPIIEPTDDVRRQKAEMSKLERKLKKFLENHIV